MVQLPTPKGIAVSGLFLLLSVVDAEACTWVLDKTKPLPTFEQRVAEAKVIYLARVVSISSAFRYPGDVTFEVFETLKGPAVRSFTLPQGGGGDCRIHFRKGETVFFGGDSGLAPTWQFTGGIPLGLESILYKLRHNIPLDVRRKYRMSYPYTLEKIRPPPKVWP